MSDLDSNKLFKIIGGNIKYYRRLYNLRKNKMTQAQLAELANVSTALIGNIESQKINQGISVYTLWKISEALEIPIEKLFDTTDFSKRSLDS